MMCHSYSANDSLYRRILGNMDEKDVIELPAHFRCKNLQCLKKKQMVHETNLATQNGQR